MLQILFLYGDVTTYSNSILTYLLMYLVTVIVNILCTSSLGQAYLQNRVVTLVHVCLYKIAWSDLCKKHYNIIYAYKQ